LKHLYVEGLRDVYSAEFQLMKALPEMAKAATSEDLRTSFEGHSAQTKEHFTRLEKIFSALGESPEGEKCNSMEGLIKQAAEMIEKVPALAELDAGLIWIAQRMEHYEIARYGGVSTYAKRLGEGEAVSLLRQTLREEIETYNKLSQLADRPNLNAASSKKSDGAGGQSRNAGMPKGIAP
jgi:ferritin-like metal-binding protein YciE